MLVSSLTLQRIHDLSLSSLDLPKLKEITIQDSCFSYVQDLTLASINMNKNTK